MKHSTHKIQRLSRIFKIVFLICAFTLPVIDAGFWITRPLSKLILPTPNCKFLRLS
ncbi:MAG TPA: hypothetical protein VGJ00_07685 [Rhabdochlamydiaceae bacterium]